MTFNEIKRNSEEMGVPLEHVVWCRLRYLRQEMVKEEQDMEEAHERGDVTGDVIFLLSLNRFMELAKESQAIATAAKRRELPSKQGSITDEQIERARQYPVSQLIDFQKGKYSAWCHEDKNPSMYLAPRINKAVCPVCNKYFSSIDILMERDGLTFTEAVKNLAA